MNETANAVHASTETPGAAPAVLPVATGDILEILGAGLRDFRAAPLYGLGVAGIYTFGGWFLILLLLRFDLPYLVYPLAAGFALIAPFVAAAFYAISSRLERGERPTWGYIFGSVWEATHSDLGWMALVTGFSLFIWMDIAALLFFAFLGFSTLSAQELLQVIFTTPMGLLFLVIGNAVGAVIALAVFSFSVTSFPMLFDRDVDFVTAMITSVGTGTRKSCATTTNLEASPIVIRKNWVALNRRIQPLPLSAGRKRPVMKESITRFSRTLLRAHLSSILRNPLKVIGILVITTASR